MDLLVVILSFKTKNFKSSELYYFFSLLPPENRIPHNCLIMWNPFFYLNKMKCWKLDINISFSHYSCGNFMPNSLISRYWRFLMTIIRVWVRTRSSSLGSRKTVVWVSSFWSHCKNLQYLLYYITRSLFYDLRSGLISILYIFRSVIWHNLRTVNDPSLFEIY